MSKSRRSALVVLLLCALLPGLARASQESSQPSQPAETVPAPPLVPAEPEPAPDLVGTPPEAAEAYQGSSVPVGVRALAELLGAGIAGSATGILGLFLGPSLFGCTTDEDCLGPIILGGLIGASVGVPVGVWGTGRLLGVKGGPGALGASYLGMGIGGGTALAAALIIRDDEGHSFIGVPVGALLGAIIGFELAASVSAPEPRSGQGQGRGPALLLAPTVGPAPGGGFMGGLSGRF